MSLSEIVLFVQNNMSIVLNVGIWTIMIMESLLICTSFCFDIF